MALWCLLLPGLTQAQVITTIAGTGMFGFSGDNSSATFAQLTYPAALAVDISGNIYVADSGNDRIRILLSSTPICTYSLSTGGQAFTAQGGTGTITITTTNPSCPWSVGTLPALVTLTSAGSGVGNGTVTFQVLPNSGGGILGAFNIAGQTFTVEQQASSIPGLAFAGSLAQIASAGTWRTTTVATTPNSLRSCAAILMNKSKRRF
jgi:hypothetical protein